MQQINLEEIRQSFQGKPFYKLVKRHLDSQKQDVRIIALQGTFSILPEKGMPFAEPFIDRWNHRIYEKDFWQMDTATVFDEILDDARSILSEARIQFNDETLFNMFNIIVLNYAYSAYDQPKMQEFMGIRSSKLLWMSTISLLYPILATVYISTIAILADHTLSTIPIIVGYGLANLGYVMFAAGIFTGTFRIFGLTKRWQVFVSAIVAFLVGTILSNVGG